MRPLAEGRSIRTQSNCITARRTWMCVTLSQPAAPTAVGVGEKGSHLEKLVPAQVPLKWSDSRTRLVLAGVDTTTLHTSSCHWEVLSQHFYSMIKWYVIITYTYVLLCSMRTVCAFSQFLISSLIEESDRVQMLCLFDSGNGNILFWWELAALTSCLAGGDINIWVSFAACARLWCGKRDLIPSKVELNVVISIYPQLIHRAGHLHAED